MREHQLDNGVTQGFLQIDVATADDLLAAARLPREMFPPIVPSTEILGELTAEAADSLGLTRGQVLRIVLLPQAFRAMLPALISQLVVVLKDTSLGFIISYEELVRVAGQIKEVLSNPIQTYLLIAVIFIVVNYALSRLAVYTERRLSQGKKTARTKGGKAATLPAADVAGAGATCGG